MLNHRLLKFLRAAHLYLGVFTAPALLFFAFTGALQTFDLHEASRGSNYKPPMWLQAMAHLHKKQSLDVPVRREGASSGSGSATMRASTAGNSAAPQSRGTAPASASVSTTAQGDHASNAPGRNLLPMKVYFALVAASLFLSTLTGLYMSRRLSRSTRRIAAALAAGVLVPLLLLAI